MAPDLDRAGACFGDVLEVLAVGRVTVTRRYSCIRRDQFEITARGPFPSTFRELLAQRGPLRGGAQLYVLDVTEAFQLTVAPGAGRALLVPRLSTELPWQRRAALEIAEGLDGLLDEP